MKRSGPRLTLGAVLAQIDEAVVAVDVEGRIFVWSAAAERVFGWSADEVMGRHFREVLRGGPSPEGDAAMAREVLSGRCLYLELLGQRRDGSLVDLEIRVAPLMGARGRVVGMVGVHRDVTDRVRDRDRSLRDRERWLAERHLHAVPSPRAEPSPGPAALVLAAVVRAREAQRAGDAAALEEALSAAEDEAARLAAREEPLGP